MRRFSLLAVAIATLLTGAPLRAQYSRDYRPASKVERELAKQAVRNVYPRDVRDSLQRYAQTLVVWPGIVTHVDTIVPGDSVRLVLSHHYFDWKEDHGCQRELYFVSPRGEGLFIVTLPPATSHGESFHGQPAVGSLLILYGRPIAIDTIGTEPAIVLSPSAANSIDRRWYSTDFFSYSRDFAEFKLLKLPEC